MKTAAAYIRVSDERQDEFSPDSQLKLFCALEFNKRNLNQFPLYNRNVSICKIAPKTIENNPKNFCKG